HQQEREQRHQGQDQRDYTLALAMFSQLALDTGYTVEQTIGYLKDNISGTSLNPAAVTAVQQAAAQFFTESNSNNKTGITNPADTNLVAIGARKAIVKISTTTPTGSLPSGRSIKGVSFNITLPAGITVKTDSNGIMSSYLSTSGVVPSGTSLIVGNLSGDTATVGMTTSTGVGLGEFATLTCDVAYYAALPQVSSFVVSDVSAFDLPLNGGTVPLTTVSVVVSDVIVQ
ncbi:MAG: hypothetical protein HGB35_08635, partial [Geobacteraceae bacterium]|nr:hypothetical protein [Geobacteraceae bacterium]